MRKLARHRGAAYLAAAVSIVTALGVSVGVAQAGPTHLGHVAANRVQGPDPIGRRRRSGRRRGRPAANQYFRPPDAANSRIMRSCSSVNLSGTLIVTSTIISPRCPSFSTP